MPFFFMTLTLASLEKINSTHFELGLDRLEPKE